MFKKATAKCMPHSSRDLQGQILHRYPAALTQSQETPAFYERLPTGGKKTLSELAGEAPGGCRCLLGAFSELPSQLRARWRKARFSPFQDLCPPRIPPVNTEEIRKPARVKGAD